MSKQPIRQSGISALQQGFTLVELIIVITLSGLVATMIASIVGNYVGGYVSTEERAGLVQITESALQKMASDLYRTVPNAIRVSTVGNDYFMEIVPVVVAAPYRGETADGGGGDTLNFAATDTSFDVYGDLTDGTDLLFDTSRLLNTNLNTAQVVVYNVGTGGPSSPTWGANLFAATGAGAHVISPAGLGISNGATNTAMDLITLDNAHQFSGASPSQTMYIVDGAVTYHCDMAANELRRYRYSGVQRDTQPTNTAAAPLAAANTALVTDNLSGCIIRYSGGTLQRSAVVSMVLTLTDNGQSTTLMKQVQISNVP